MKNININLVDFLPELAPLTADGRWQIVQEWLEDNPEYAERLDEWLELTPDEVFPDLREIAAEAIERRYGALGGVLARTAEMTPQLWQWIATLQTCYRERLEFDRKEKKSDGRKKRLAHKSKRI